MGGCDRPAGEPEPPAEIVGGHEPEETGQGTPIPVVGGGEESDTPAPPSAAPEGPAPDRSFAPEAWTGDPTGPAPRDRVVTGRRPPPTIAPRSTPDVVLITVDTWRADRLGLYGSPRTETSTHLAAWAAEGIVFEQAYAPAPWTLPTIASIATGLYPSAHGAVSQDSALCDAPETLAEVLHRSGRRTGFAGSNGYFEPTGEHPVDSGLAQGFEYFWGRGLEAGPRVLEFARYFLDGIGAEDPAFLHVHLFDPHCPYAPPPDAAARVAEPRHGLPDHRAVQAGFADVVRQSGACHFVPVLTRGLPDREVAELEPGSDLQEYLDAYDGDLVVTDGILNDLAALLAERARWDAAWVIVTGDHGEEFGDHGKLGHGKNAYVESARVPLLIRPPRGEAGWARGTRVATPVSLVDLPATVAALLGAERPDTWQGRDLSPALRGEPLAPAPVLCETDYEGHARLLVHDGVALHRDLEHGRRLYRMDADPAMRSPLGDAADPGLSARMDELIAAEERRIAGGRVCQAATRVLSPEQIEKLEALGYIVAPTPAPPPGR